MQNVPGLDAVITSISYNTKFPTTPTIATDFIIRLLHLTISTIFLVY